MYYYTMVIQIPFEAISAIACIILARFMIKPFQLTREGRYLGLPLGFGLLSLSFIFAIVYFTHGGLMFVWLTDICRVFAFIFLSATYYFSKKPSKNARLLWNLTLGLLILTLITLSSLLVVVPHSIPLSYPTAQMYLRIASALLLVYIFIHTLKSHIEKPDPTTIWVPFGFLFFALSQYSFLFLNDSRNAVWGGYGFRLAGLAVFLLVAYRTFYSSKDASKNEKDLAQR